MTVKCPICIREPHCGHQAACDEPEDLGRTISVSFRCLHCEATGVQSTRKDLTRAATEWKASA